MPRHVQLIIVFALDSIVDGLLLLRGSVKKLPLNEEQPERIHERNAELSTQEVKDR